MRHSRLSVNILPLPGSVFSGFFIYFTLSYFLVPFRITAPLSIIMSFIIFGLTKYYSEQENPFGTETKIFHNKFQSNLFFVIIYAILIISSFLYNQSTSTLFTPWEQFTGIQIVNLGIAISLSIFMPGYALVNIFDKKDELKTLPKFLLAYILSALATGLTGFIWGSLGFAVSDIKPILIGIHLVILILFILNMFLKKDSQPHDFRLNSFFGTLKQNSAKILVFVSLFALIILSTYYLYNGTIIGDQWVHHGKSLLFSTGAYKDDLTALGNYDQFEPFLPAFLAVFFTISGVSSVNSYASISFLNIIPVLAFYYFFTRWFPNHRMVALLASTLFMLSSGFGWKYVLSLANTQPITTLESAIQIFQSSGYRTFDIWAPNTFIDVAHPDITCPLIIFGLPAGFVLLGLIKEKMSNKLRYFAILLAPLMLGYLGHGEFGLFIIVACIILLILKLDGKNSVFAAIFATLLFVIFNIIFLSGSLYTYPRVVGVPLIFLLFLFVSIMWTLYASKILLKVYNLKILSNRIKKPLNRKTKIIICIITISIFSSLYLFSFIIWNSTPTFDIRHDTTGFKVVPWYFYPIRFGVAGLLGLAFIVSLIFRRYEREVIILAVIGIAAFLMGPYYNEFRFNKYIMVSFVGVASLLLLRILTSPSLLKPLRNGMIIGLVLTLSSLSILMFIGDNAIALETTSNTNFDNDLPKRHFPTDIAVLEFLHSNINLKTDNIALDKNEANRFAGFVLQLEGFVGLPLVKPLENPNILQGTSLEGFYTLLDYNKMRYIVLSKEDIKNGLSEVASFALENFPKPYTDNDYVVLSVPPLNPPSSRGDVTLLLPDTQYPVNSSTIFSSSTMGYKSQSLVSDSSKFTQVTKTKILSGNNTLLFNTPIKNVTYIEGRFSVINETANDNHSGIVWYDGNMGYYLFLRSGKVSIYNTHDGEFKAAKINREDGAWYTLKIIYENDNIKMFVNNELKLQIARNSSDIPNISKVGIRSYNDVTEFELLKVGQAKVSNFDLKYNYYYPVSALAFSNIEYQTLSDQDLSVFSKKNVIITIDPLEESKYVEFVRKGGNIIILNSDDNFNGQFSNIMSLKSGNKIRFNSVDSSEGISMKIFGYASNIEINSTDSHVTSYYSYNGKKMAPFIIEKKYGDGKIDFVNTRGYFEAISQSPQQYFPTIENILDMLHLSTEKYIGGSTNHTYFAQFVGGLNASGQVLINGSSLFIPGNEFYTLVSKQYDNYAAIPSSQIYENGSNYVKIHDLNLHGPFNIFINSTNLLYVSSSEFGYTTLSFPKGFNMTIKLVNGSSAEFLVDENNQTSKVTSNTIQFKGIKIQSEHSPQTVLMRNPEIMINGNTVFDKLYSRNPTDPASSWVDGNPMTIVGRTIINIDHVDNDVNNDATPMTYFKWIMVNSSSDIYRQ